MSKKRKPRKTKEAAKANTKLIQKKWISTFFEVYFFPVTLVLILPFVNTNDLLDYNSAPRLALLGLTVLIVALYNLFYKKQKENNPYGFLKLAFFPVALVYLLWILITLIPAINPWEGSFDVTKSILTISLLVFLVQFFLVQNNAITVLVKSVVISAIIACSTGIYQYINHVSGKSGNDIYMALYAVKGLMAHKNQFAIALMLMLPFTVYGIITLKKWWWKAGSSYAVFVIFVNIVIIQTRSVWIATLFFVFSGAVLSFVFLTNKNIKNFIIQNKKVIAISFGVIILTTAATVVIIKQTGSASVFKEQASTTFSTESSNAQWRIKMWKSSLQLFADHPLFGVGAGNWKMAIIPYYHLNFGSNYQNWRRPHNDYLWVLTEKGMPGLLLFLTLFILVFYYGLKILFKEKEKNKLLLVILTLSGLTSYLVVSMFTFPLERINQQVYLSLLLAIIISIYYKSNPVPPFKKDFNIHFKINLIILLLASVSLYYSYLFIKAEWYTKKAMIALNSHNSRKVIKYINYAYTPFTSIDYNNVPVKMYSGIAYMQLKKTKEGYNDLEEALNSFPNQVAVLNNLAISAFELNKKEEAEGYFNKALSLFPHYEQSLSNMVIAYYKNKDYKNAYLALLNQDTRKPNKQYKDFKRTLERLINGKNQVRK